VLLQSRYSEQILHGPIIPHGFPPTLAYSDQECLVVSEGEDVQKVNHIIDNNNSERSWIAPGVHRGSSVPCCAGGPARGLAHGPGAVEREVSPGGVVTADGSSPPPTGEEGSAEGPAKPHGPPPSAWNTVLLGSFKDTGYVVGAEGPGKEGVQAADGKQDYSRVSGVNGEYGLPDLVL